MALNGTILAGKALKVTVIGQRKGEPESAVPVAKKAMKKQKQEFTRNKRSIFVGNLHESVTEDQVRKLLETCGKVAAIRMGQTKAGEPNGMCIAVMDKDRGVRKALNLTGTELNALPIRVEPFKTTQEVAEAESGVRNAMECFLQNVPHKATEGMVQGAMEKFGTVASVRLILKDGMPTGNAVVMFDDKASVSKVCRWTDRMQMLGHGPSTPNGGCRYVPQSIALGVGDKCNEA